LRRRCPCSQSPFSCPLAGFVASGSSPYQASSARYLAVYCSALPSWWTASVMRSVRCRAGTPPSSHRAFCSPSLRLAKLSEKQTLTCSQFECVSTKWYSRCGKGWPLRVTPRPSKCVKSEAPSRPGSCTCAKKTSLAEPCCAFHWRTRRSSVRRRRSQDCPGCSRCSHSSSVLACSPGSRCSKASSCGHTAASGSGRVRQRRGRRASLGSAAWSRYFRAVLRSMPARIAACVSDAPRKSPFRSSFTWASVARRPVRIGNSFHQKLPLF
jgi:hypothetical protein